MDALEVLAKMSDKKCKKEMQELVGAKDAVYSYMLAGKYST